jgi:hypothetical protein
MSEELKGFTPVAPDRDAILFAAGRASVRRWAGWKWLTVGLIASNAVTLGVLFWPNAVADTPAVFTPELPPTDPAPPLPPEPYSYIALRQGDAPPAADGGDVAPSVPLTPRAILDQSW